MAAIGSQVTVGTATTGIFTIVDTATYLANGYTRAANPTIYQAKESADPLPMLISIPTGATVFLGGSGVTSSGGAIGASVVGPTTISYNAVGGDSLYGIVGTGTGVVSVLVLRQ